MPAKETALCLSILSLGNVPSRPLGDGTLRLEILRLKSEVVVISACGDIDASDVGAVVRCTLGQVAGCRGLILDLRWVDFFGAGGFLALHKISANCARARIGWALLLSAAVSRVLSVCDPQASLPAVSTLDASLAERLTRSECPFVRVTSVDSATCRPGPVQPRCSGRPRARYWATHVSHRDPQTGEAIAVPVSGTTTTDFQRESSAVGPELPVGDGIGMKKDKATQCEQNLCGRRRRSTTATPATHAERPLTLSPSACASCRPTDLFSIQTRLDDGNAEE
ncbi:hypothetical protein DSM43518_00955 [Mycobacterium marinum]|nr:hypothetical protein MM1218R_01805 [Mycobacterium marinum]CDM75859.1 hypothetical protein MMARE11_17110 [Mycobacterium marinum E11]AXN49114.1 hypothetical protein CCUG20998_01702 [Mycobacterium marinum]RFZ14242.1 hypothetical protein DE4381_00096 [Mycobacterium marinum]RFZ14302.1 hypothetical protein DSM43518_00955 [Mycobacterium marinum]